MLEAFPVKLSYDLCLVRVMVPVPIVIAWELLWLFSCLPVKAIEFIRFMDSFGLIFVSYPVEVFFLL